MRALREQSTTIDEYAKARLCSSLDSYEEKLSFFYGQIHTLSLRFEVTELKKRALALEKWSEKKSLEEIVALANALEQEIDSLCHKHSLSREDRVAIGAARGAISRARAEPSPLKGRTTLPGTPLSEALPDLDLICELFEIARSFYIGKLSDGKTKLLSLPAEGKKILYRHALSLGLNEELFTINPLETMQVLIATAYELSGCEAHPLYPTEAQIATLFDDVEEIMARDYFEPDTKYKL